MYAGHFQNSKNQSSQFLYATLQHKDNRGGSTYSQKNDNKVDSNVSLREKKLKN